MGGEEFKIGSLAIKVDTYRSTPAVNLTDDMARIQFTGPIVQLRPLLSMLEQVISITPEYVDPNRDLPSKKWYRLCLVSGKLIERAMNNEWAYEEWVNGAPGTDQNYVKVIRFVSIDETSKKSNEHAEIVLHGNAELTELFADDIRVTFLGEGGDPNYCYEVEGK